MFFFPFWKLYRYIHTHTHMFSLKRFIYRILQIRKSKHHYLITNLDPGASQVPLVVFLPGESYMDRGAWRRQETVHGVTNMTEHKHTQSSPHTCQRVQINEITVSHWTHTPPLSSLLYTSPSSYFQSTRALKMKSTYNTSHRVQRLQGPNAWGDTKKLIRNLPAGL